MIFPAMEDDKSGTKKLLILYASETGNAIDAAERLGREAERRRCPAAVRSVDEVNPKSLPSEETVIFVVSTTGQGDVPGSMKGFWKFLLQKNLSERWLEEVHYAVFGLGDSSYQKYNFVAKKLDKRLLGLGANAIIERGLGDDQHPSGYEGTLDPWMSNLWNELYQRNPRLFPSGPDILDDQWVDQPKLEIIYHDSYSGKSISSFANESEYLEMQIERARSMSPGKSSCKIKPDCFLKLTENCSLTKEGCGKDVRHLEFEAASSSVKYEVGDYVELLPGQDPVVVDAFIKRCNLDPEAYITVQPKRENLFGDTKYSPVKLKTFVELTMDIASASPRRYFFEIMSLFANAQHEKERLEYFASSEGRDDLYQYNQKERRTVLEVLEDFPSVEMPFEWLVQLVPPLKPRAFSIASSSLVHPNHLHLTVSIVSWTTPYKRKRSGLCSTWLAGFDPQKRTSIPAWLHKGSLPSPSPTLPLILIGPGTGCAPFRGFVQERAFQSKSSPTAPVLFFFGCRSKDDFLYQDFWKSHAQTGGVLSEENGGGFYVAFSREQPNKVYVQHKMREQSKKIWNLLTQGAAVYVAGSADKMPSDVMSALEDIISLEKGATKEGAGRLIRALEKAGKYHVESWS